MKLLVTMGFHTNRSGDQWLYDTAALALIDWDQKKIVKELTYHAPQERRAMDGHMLFACGQMLGPRRLLVTTHTEVLFIDLDSWKVDKVISSKHFNDLHHAILVDKDLYVCNTGIQAIQRLNLDGQVLETISTNEVPTWEAYDQNKDYRPENTKPHPVHPNHLFVYGGNVWVTRAQLKDAVMVRDHLKRMNIGIGTPHDGMPYGEEIYFTTTNGHVVIMDGKICEKKRVIDLNKIDSRNQQLGWCRSLHRVDEDRTLVGFGQFRRSKIKQFAHWIMSDGKAALPSRIALYDLKKQALQDEMQFTGRYEGLAMFSIFMWPE